MAEPKSNSAGNSSEYRVLALKYRPQVFDDVVGQKSVVRQLQGEIRDGRVGHAYLFTGPRGVGKTSMARIFAKALNCVEGPTPKPCGQCTHCLGIANDSDLDVVEVDAATYTRKEETVELLEGIDRVAFNSRYKVYIIDEVHMFSTHSFNVLLKRLEEPPPGVVFILATTNPEKIPDTVISRCRRLEFDRMDTSEIVNRLNEIAQKEKVKFAEEDRLKVLEAIALACEGGMRDAQVALDQLISLSDGKVTLDAARQLLGIVESDLLHQLFAALVKKDTVQCLLLVHDLVEKGRDLQRFIKTFTMYLRDAMLAKANAPDELLKVTKADPGKLRQVVQGVSMPSLLNMVQQFLDLEERMKGAAPARFVLEFALMKLTAIHPTFVLDAMDADKLKAAGPRSAPGGGPRPGGGGGGEARMAAAQVAERTPLPEAAAARNQPPITGMHDGHEVPMLHRSVEPAEPQPAAEVRVSRSAEPAPQGPMARVVALHTAQPGVTIDSDSYNRFRSYVREKAPQLSDIINDAELHCSEEDGLSIRLAYRDSIMKTQLERPEKVVVLAEACKRGFGRAMRIRISVAPPAMSPESSPPSLEGEELEAAPAVVDMAPVAREMADEPVRLAAAVGQDESPLGKPSSYAEALQRFPDFREAIDLVKRHFGTDPILFNGQRLN